MGPERATVAPRGFTLLELLVTLFIIVVAVGVVVPTIGKSRLASSSPGYRWQSTSSGAREGRRRRGGRLGDRFCQAARRARARGHARDPRRGAGTRDRRRGSQPGVSAGRGP